MHRRELQLIEPLEHPRRLLHPARQRLTVENDALAREILASAGRVSRAKRIWRRRSGRRAPSRPCRPRPAAPEPEPARRGSRRRGRRIWDRIVRSTRSVAGMRSSVSLTSSPMRRILPLQQGHCVVVGSMTRSQRGRCSGSLPMLRSAFLRGFFVAGSRSRPHQRRSLAHRLAAFHESQRELLDPDRRKPLGARAENQRPQRHDCRAQALVLRREARAPAPSARSDRVGRLSQERVMILKKIPRPAPR